MQAILEELRDLMETNLKTSNTAEAGTTTTNIKVTAHGLITGDIIINASRSDARRAITQVDANNFTVETVTGQTTSDTINFPKFKKFYVGNIDELPHNYLPALMVYGSETILDTPRLTLQTDKYIHKIHVKILTSAYLKVAEAEDVDFILQAQKQLKVLMEDRDTNGIPKATSILGVFRRNIRGTNYLYNNDIVIDYGEGKKVGDRLYYSATMDVSGVTQYTSRS